MLRLMIDSHPEIAIPPETHFIPALHPQMDREAFLTALLSSSRWNDFHLDRGGFREAVAAVEQFSVATGLRVFYGLYASRFGKRRWGDKTPAYSANIARIAGLLTEARFIHLIRDGRDSALSYRGLWFGPGSDVEAHAHMWMGRIREARRQAQESNVPYLELRFEDLVRDTEATLKAITAFLDVPFDPAMLSYHERARERIGELEARDADEALSAVTRQQRISIFTKTFEPPDETRIGVWRREMTTSQRSVYLETAGSLLKELGYE